MTDIEYIKDRREGMDALFDDVKEIKAHLIGTLTTEGQTVRVNKCEKKIEEINNVILERKRICEDRHDPEKAYSVSEKKKHFTWVHASIFISNFIAFCSLMYAMFR